MPSPAQYLRSLGFLPYHMDGRVIKMGHIWWSQRSRERSSVEVTSYTRVRSRQRRRLMIAGSWWEGISVIPEMV